MKYKLFALFFLLFCSAGFVAAQPPMGQGPKPGVGGKGPKPDGKGPKADAKKEKAAKKAAEESMSPYEVGKLPGQVYVFGVSYQFGDTITYMTDVCMVDSIMLQKKTKFLPFRYDFSIQLKEYLEGKKGLKQQTSCVFFSEKKRKLEKKLSKIRKRALKAENNTLVVIPADEFSFIHPLDNTTK